MNFKCNFKANIIKLPTGTTLKILMSPFLCKMQRLAYFYGINISHCLLLYSLFPGSFGAGKIKSMQLLANIDFKDNILFQYFRSSTHFYQIMKNLLSHTLKLSSSHQLLFKKS